MRPPNRKVKALAARLVGTCDGAVDEIEELTMAETRGLDMLIFNCVHCGWWFHKRECHDTSRGWSCGECLS